MARDWILDVDGMTCDSCERHVAEALEAVGARDVTASWREGTAHFAFAGAPDEARVRAAVEAAGYAPRTLRPIRDPDTVPDASGDVDYDLVVVGSGSAAYAAAIQARDHGHRVALIERDTVGGTCVDAGCVPSKALLRAGEVFHQAGHHPFAGIGTAPSGLDLAELVRQKDDLVAALRRDKYLDLVDVHGFDVIPGTGRFADPDTLDVDGRELRSRAFLVATGASPALPPIPGLEEAGYLTSTTALDLEELPEQLVVIGANAIGLELGQCFAHLGSRVTFLDVAERVAPFEEPEVSEALTRILADDGSEVLAPARVTGVARDGDRRRVSVEVAATERVLGADDVLVATGRRPNTDRLGLEAAGVEVDERGAVVVDEHLRTSNPRVFAAGDVTPAPQFVYVSAYEGALAARNALLGAGERVDLCGLPRVTFTRPQIASAGFTEAEAREQGHAVRTAVLDLADVPRALVNRDTRGLIKLVADAETDRLLGAAALAESAGEVIQSAVLAIRFGITTGELAGTFHPYLTMVEGLRLAAQTFTRDVKKLSCCAA